MIQAQHASLELEHWTTVQDHLVEKIVGEMKGITAAGEVSRVRLSGTSATTGRSISKANTLCETLVLVTEGFSSLYYPCNVSRCLTEMHLGKNVIL
jgi:hypothetical protein